MQGRVMDRRARFWAILVDFWDWAEKLVIAGGIGLALGMWAKIVVRWLS